MPNLKPVLVLLAVAATLAVAASPAHADQAEEGLLPTCAPTTTADPTWNPDESHWHDQVSENTSVGPTDQYVGMGLAHDCAYQSWRSSELICEGEFNCHRSDVNVYHPFVHGYAFPDTFDAADGDHQRVTITMPGTAPWPSGGAPGVGWGACFPGFKWHEPLVLTGCDPTAWQYNGEESTWLPGTTDSFPAPGGTMVYRPRSAGGTFTGPWTASLGDASPGFHLQHVGATPCTTTATSCEYELDFTRDPTGQLQVTQDMQVVLQLPATAVEDEGPVEEAVAVPMLVIQTGGNGKSTGGGPGDGGGSGGSGAGGGGAAGGGPSSAPARPKPKPLRCKKGFVKRKAHGKARCVRSKPKKHQPKGKKGGR